MRVDSDVELTSVQKQTHQVRRNLATTVKNHNKIYKNRTNIGPTYWQAYNY